jgi:C4-dicarboxylate-binding protein DctP
MIHPLSRRGFVVAAAAGLAAPAIARGAAPFRLRCSLDTAPVHARNVAIGDYLHRLETASDGRIRTELFHAGALAADAAVPQALAQGQVEMACPGSWVLTGAVADCDVVNLPVLYSQPIELCRRVLDGKTGAHINAQLRRALRARVLGPWLHLGFQHWYSATRPIAALADLKGLTIRNGGGAATAWRTRFFNAVPTTTPWPEVTPALSQGRFEGLITTNESAFSARLWEAGVKTTIQDRQSVDNYVPLVSEAFFDALPWDLQALLITTWQQNVGGYRAAMLDAQDLALEGLRAHGVVDTTPPDEEIAALREAMLAEQHRLVKEWRLSAELPGLLTEDIGQRSAVPVPSRAALARQSG